MAKKRMTAAQMVSGASCNGALAPGSSWFMLLNEGDREFVNEVVNELKKDPMASRLSVAKLLIEQLEIKRAPGTVARTLENMVRKIMDASRRLNLRKQNANSD